MINLDPSFKMMEVKNDNKLMMKDVLHELLCEKYEEKTPQFIDLVERIAPGKTDMPLVNTIFRLYRFAISHAWPTEWLDDCRKIYNVTEKEDIDKLSIIKDSGVLLSAKTMTSQGNMPYGKSSTRLCLQWLEKSRLRKWMLIRFFCPMNMRL